MSFDYGSIDLGLKNPFKKEGAVTALRGGIQTILGLYLLVQAAGSVKQDAGLGWILVLFGVFLLAGGVRSLSSGIYATLRYFVGRNHPTSLARNFSKSEASTSQEESAYVAYDQKRLEEMLVGRKNTTFIEPQGFLARLVHSFFPKLLYMPYPVRNLAQRLFGAWVKMLTAIVAYGFVAFVSLSGFAGAAGELAFPIYSALLMFYLMLIWRSAASATSRSAEKNIDSLGSGDLVKVIAVSIIMPVVVGVVLSWLMQQTNTSSARIEGWFALLPELNTGAYLAGVFVLAAIASVIILVLLRARLSQANPLSEVSELRENWQESVHPNEIFINLDNLVMANRRFKEVPNRVYKELDPQLIEQVEGKGGFKGEMIHEIQPRVSPMNLGAVFDRSRLASLIGGNLLFIGSIILTLMLAYALVDIYKFSDSFGSEVLKSGIDSKNLPELMLLIMAAFHLLLIGFVVKSFASLLVNTAHLFYAEIQFESMLIYFKCEGTFTESKISTGTGIHDSTRSENTLVRSSITPWIIVSRIISSTFAATGMKNLEHPRHILEMHRDEAALQSIKSDVISFLKDRESIASITSARDLGNASQIHQLNEQTRARVHAPGLAQSEEAAGFLSKEAELALEGGTT